MARAFPERKSNCYGRIVKAKPLVLSVRVTGQDVLAFFSKMGVSTSLCPARSCACWGPQLREVRFADGGAMSGSS